MGKKVKMSAGKLEQNVDRISYLPDPIRSHIISFLPMKQAIRTSILSKRWRNICCSLSNLEFSHRSFEGRRYNRRDFKDLVYQTLILHDGSDLQKFNISVDQHHVSATHILAWISFAVRHNVREFEYSASDRELHKLPSCLFTCRTLTKLSLNDVKLSFPTIINLPVLKKLQLLTVSFHDGIPPNQLISSCPMLEDLFIIPDYDAQWNHQIVLTISSPCIKSLGILGDFPTHAIKISTPNLQRIQYSSYPPDISLGTLSSLYYAYFAISKLPNSVEIVDDVVGHTSKILMGLHCISILRLGGYTVEYLSRVEDLSALKLTSCVNLKRLELDVCPQRHQVRFTTFLLSSYPNLETLYISVRVNWRFENLPNVECSWESQELSTEGILQNLKTVSFDIFEGSEGELNLVRFLLKNANILEKMDIEYFRQTEEGLASMKEKIMAFSKVSSHAVISFSTYFNYQFGLDLFAQPCR